MALKFEDEMDDGVMVENGDTGYLASHVTTRQNGALQNS